MWATGALILQGETEVVGLRLQGLEVLLNHRLAEFPDQPVSADELSAFAMDWARVAHRETLFDRCAVRTALGRADAEADCRRAESIEMRWPQDRNAGPREAMFAYAA